MTAYKSSVLLKLGYYTQKRDFFCVQDDKTFLKMGKFSKIEAREVVFIKKNK